MSNPHDRQLFADLVVSTLRAKMSFNPMYGGGEDEEMYLPEVKSGSSWCDYLTFLIVVADSMIQVESRLTGLETAMSSVQTDLQLIISTLNTMVLQRPEAQQQQHTLQPQCSSQQQQLPIEQHHSYQQQQSLQQQATFQQ